MKATTLDRLQAGLAQAEKDGLTGLVERLNLEEMELVEMLGDTADQYVKEMAAIVRKATEQEWSQTKIKAAIRADLAIGLAVMISVGAALREHDV